MLLVHRTLQADASELLRVAREPDPLHDHPQILEVRHCPKRATKPIRRRISTSGPSRPTLADTLRRQNARAIACTAHHLGPETSAWRVGFLLSLVEFGFQA
eukprot:3880282-Rhodomonas_salina.1